MVGGNLAPPIPQTLDDDAAATVEASHWWEQYEKFSSPNFPLAERADRL